MKLGSPSKKVLITGISGFTGVHLKCTLESLGYQVFGITHSDTKANNCFIADLGDKDSIEKVLNIVDPDYIIHLAAISFVGHGDANEFYRVNVLGTENLLKSVTETGIKPDKIIVSSSANIYGNLGGIIPETACPEPVNHYACSKLAMERIVTNYFSSLPIIITRPFNYTGVGQADHFLVPKIVYHFNEKAHQIELGNVNVYRDFSSVHFVVESYLSLMKSSYESEVFNVCSGKSISLKEIIGYLEDVTGHEIEIRVNPKFVRANEVTSITGDNSKLMKAFPSLEVIEIKETIKEMLEE